MYFLQEGIMGGIVLLVMIGIAFLIGVPLITILLRSCFNRKEEKDQNRKIGHVKTGNNEDQLQAKQVDTLLIRIILALVIMIIFIVVAVKIIDAVFPGFD